MLPIVCLRRLLLRGVDAILTASIRNRKVPQLTSLSENHTLDSNVITGEVILMPRKGDCGTHLLHFSSTITETTTITTTTVFDSMGSLIVVSHHSARVALRSDMCGGSGQRH